MDLTIINEALGLASNAIGLTGKAASTIGAIKGLFDGEKTPDSGEASKLLNALASELTLANMTNVQLSDALKKLSQELLRQDEFEREKSRYELFETGQGDILLRLRASAANGQPSHYVCPVCLNRDKLISYVTGQGDYKLCQTNNTHAFRFSETEYRRAMRSNNDWSAHDY